MRCKHSTVKVIRQKLIHLKNVLSRQSGNKKEYEIFDNRKVYITVLYWIQSPRTFLTLHKKDKSYKLQKCLLGFY